MAGVGSWRGSFLSQWSPGGVHTATDVRCVENLASLSEVKGLKSSSRVASRGQCGVLKTSTAMEIMAHCEGMSAPYLGPDKFDPLFATKELARDMQSLRMLSTLKLRRFAWCLSSVADVSPFFAYSDEPATMLVWTDADWSGNELTCKSTSAGAVQLTRPRCRVRTKMSRIPRTQAVEKVQSSHGRPGQMFAEQLELSGNRG